MAGDGDFRELSEAQLQRLSDDELIAYLRTAAARGNTAAARKALGILMYGRMDYVVKRMRMRVPREVADDEAATALTNAVASAFDGVSIGEFHNWLTTIIDRTAINYHRRTGRRPKESLLPTEHQGEDDVWGDEPAQPDDKGIVGTEQLVKRALDELNETHRQVVELHVFDDLDAKTVADQVDDMTADNVAQIASRFRKRVRDLLDESDTG